jgi:ABC-type phosphate transport system substrate-binding protein
VLTLSLILATPIHGLTAETILVDGSTGVMPLAAALAKAYQEQHPATTLPTMPCR